MYFEKILSRRETLGAFVAFTLIYVYPIIKADYAYVDDNWRSLLLADTAWVDAGRPLLEVLNNFLVFNDASINIFPLPLLICSFAMALAMSRLTYWFFPQPDLIACVVVLPILCSPFFLGNITYQYDGPGMMLAVVSAIYALTCDPRNVIFRTLLSAVLITTLLSLYQPAISVFIGLCFVESVWAVKNKRPANEILLVIAVRGLQVVMGGLLYYLTSYQMVDNSRGDLDFFEPQWFEKMSGKFLYSMEKVVELVNSGNFFVFIFLLLTACLGFVWLLKNIFVLKGGGAEKVIVLMVCLCSIPVLIVSVPGVMLFLSEPNLEARNYLGFSVVLLFLFLLSYECLGRIRGDLRLFLIVPVLCMYSFCYAYGQVIVSKKELETALATFIAYDLFATPELENINKFYLLRVGDENWLPRGHGAMSYMPTLRYILTNYNALVHAHFMTRLGVNNVVDGNWGAFERVMSSYKAVTPILDRKLYSIYVTEVGAFIVMKHVVDPEEYIEKP